MIQATDQACDNAWNSYLYKGSGCAGVPWAEDLAGGDEETTKMTPQNSAKVIRRQRLWPKPTHPLPVPTIK